MRFVAKTLQAGLTNVNGCVYSQAGLEMIAEGTRKFMSEIKLLMHEEPVVSTPWPPMSSAVGYVDKCHVRDCRLVFEGEITRPEMPGVSMIRSQSVGLAPVVVMTGDGAVKDCGGFTLMGDDKNKELFMTLINGERERGIGELLFTKCLAMYPMSEMPEYYRNSVVIEDDKRPKQGGT